MIGETCGTDGRISARVKIRIGIRLIACGLLIVAVQWAFWIDQGQWSPCDLRALLSWLCTWAPSTDWPLGQALIDLALGLPLSALCVVIGVILALIGTASAGNDVGELAPGRRG